MKTYIFNAINRYKRFSENLEVQSVICNKSWWVFNDSGEKELYIFQEDGTLYITLNGKVTNGTWKYITANKSLIIGTESQSYMVHAAFIDATLLTLQVDGTEKCAFLVNETNKQTYLPQTYSDIMSYFLIKEQMCIKEEEERKQRQLEEEKANLAAEERRKEEERLRAIEETERLRLNEEEQKRLDIEINKSEQEHRKAEELFARKYLAILKNDKKFIDLTKRYYISIVVLVALFIIVAISNNDSPILGIFFMVWLFILIPTCVYKRYSRANEIKKELLNNMQ